MTINDIVVNCGSMLSDTLIIIANDFGEVKWQSTFKNLPLNYENLNIKFFTVGNLMYGTMPRVYFKFYV